MEIPTINMAECQSTQTSRQTLVAEIRRACENQALEQSKHFFALPLDVKEKYDKNGFNRGYERLRAQNFEKTGSGDLKEGYYFGTNLPLDHPMVVNKKFNLGPNKYPTDVQDPEKFRQVVDTYFDSMRSLAERLLRLLCESLEIGDEWVPRFTETPIAILRLLHYPPQAPNAPDMERGIGAHTDFGALTILLQDMVGGLQVWDRLNSQWVEVKPSKGALVVNLGNLMMRWTNDRYLSNLHRVINRSGQERYSIPFFFSGNPDFIVKCLPSEKGELKAKYPPVTVEDWIKGRYADTYAASSKVEAFGELSVAQATAAQT
ncbi:hypothetical protein EsH8_VIII_001083 [Colletotrichum jinshuiense]